MMRKLQIEAAAMNIERDAQQLHAHGRAFDVPARAALSPGTVPFRFAGFGPFPEREISRVALFLAYLDACAGFQLFGVAMAELAVIVVARDVEIDISIGGIG